MYRTSGLIESYPHAFADAVLFPAFPVEQRIAPKRWQLLLPYEYAWEHEDRLHRIRVSAGFVYDGASVPRLVRGLIDPDVLHKISCHHDWGYNWQGALPYGSHQVLGREGWIDALEVETGERLAWARGELDRLMMRMGREDRPDGPGPHTRKVVYSGLRTGGWWAWRRAKRS